MTRERMIRTAVEMIFKNTLAHKVILFGSALGNEFDSHSDLDFVVLFEEMADRKTGEKWLYRNASLFPTQVDFICVTRVDFQKKAAIGGVLQIALEDGRPFDRP